MKKFILVLATAATILITGCGSTEDSSLTSDLTITIDAMTFSPSSLTASAGDTVTVINDDDTPHTVTSESAEGAFDDSGDFSVTVTSGSAGVFTLSSTAVSGDVFFFYCAFHTSAMTPANGTITIE